MELHPKLRREIHVSGDTGAVSTRLAAEMPKAGIRVEQHLPGIRILANVFDPASLNLGQEIRVDFRALEDDDTVAFVESRFHYPGIDFTHANDKIVSMIESMLRAG